MSCQWKLVILYIFFSHIANIISRLAFTIKCTTIRRAAVKPLKILSLSLSVFLSLSHDIKHTWSRRSGMGLARQLFLLRRGGGTGACGRDDADIFGGSGGFTVLLLPFLPRSRRCLLGKGEENDVSVSMIKMRKEYSLQLCTYFSQMILSLRVTMELVIARVAEQILHALLALDDGTDCTAEFTL